VTWAVVEYDRTPKLGYYTLQQVYQPVLIGANIERGRMLTDTDLGGHPRPLRLVPWVVNDRVEPLAGCTWQMQLEIDGKLLPPHTSAPFDVPADGVLPHAPLIETPAPPPAAYTLRLSLLHGGEVISTNSYEVVFETLPIDAKELSL
jgi:beta-mannosidase